MITKSDKLIKKLVSVMYVFQSNFSDIMLDISGWLVIIILLDQELRLAGLNIDLKVLLIT